MASFLLRAARRGCSRYQQHEAVRWDRGQRIREHMRVVTGHAQEGVPKQTVAGRVPSILQSILIKNGAKGSIR